MRISGVAGDAAPTIGGPTMGVGGKQLLQHDRLWQSFDRQPDKNTPTIVTVQKYFTMIGLLCSNHSIVKRGLSPIQ